MPTDEDLGLEGLHVGDFIYLNYLRVENGQNLPDGYLSAEGIISEDVHLDPSSSSISSHLFCIHIQLQYSAHRELEEFNSLRIHDTDAKDLATIKYQQALERSYSNEKALNEQSLNRCKGTPVCFGDTIQLFHVLSEKYVTILPDQLAEEERENLKVVMSSHGSSLSWLKLTPRYKIDRVGERISSKHEIAISIFERGGEYMHVAQKEAREGRFREINCCLEVSWWAIHRYQGFEESIEEKQLLTSQLLVLQVFVC